MWGLARWTFRCIRLAVSLLEGRTMIARFIVLSFRQILMEMDVCEGVIHSCVNFTHEYQYPKASNSHIQGDQVCA
jgi:hypothetical protein